MASLEALTEPGLGTRTMGAGDHHGGVPEALARADSFLCICSSNLDLGSGHYYHLLFQRTKQMD